MNKIVRIAVLSFLSATAARAAEPRNQAEVDALWKASHITIVGRDTPDLVPLRVRMSAFYALYKLAIRDELQSLLSPADFKVIDDFAVVLPREMDRLGNDFNAKWMALGATAPSMGPMDIALADKALVDDLEAGQDALFERLLSRLSLSGRNAVEDFAYRRVRPTFQQHIPLYIAQQAPLYYKDVFLGIYREKLAMAAGPAAAKAGVRPGSEEGSTTLSGETALLEVTGGP